MFTNRLLTVEHSKRDPERLRAIATTHPGWRAQPWTGRELAELSDALPLLARFEQGEAVAEAGEHGVWVGFLLSGRLVVHLADGSTVDLQPGDAVGEMALEHMSQTRCATVRAVGSGYVGAIAINDFGAFISARPLLGGRLVALLSQAAAARRRDNARRARAAAAPPALIWGEAEGAHSEAREELHDVYRARLAALVTQQVAATPASVGQLDGVQLTQVSAFLVYCLLYLLPPGFPAS